MKRLFLVIIVAICFNQSYSQCFLNYGVKAGYNSSNQKWDYSNSFIKMEWDNYSGMNIKGFVSYSTSSYLELESEIAYIQKGVQADVPYSTFENPDGNGELIRISHKFNYITTSLLGKAKYNISLLTPYVITGLEYNLLFNVTGFSPYTKEFNNTIGFTLGGGTEINLSLVTLLLEYRYSKDLTTTFNNGFLNIKNYSHSVSTGIKL